MHSVFLLPHSGADKDNFITRFYNNHTYHQGGKIFRSEWMFLTPPQYLALYIYAQNIRLHEYVILVHLMSGCGCYGCIPRMPKEHGMHRQVTRPILFACWWCNTSSAVNKGEGSGTETNIDHGWSECVLLFLLTWMQFPKLQNGRLNRGLTWLRQVLSVNHQYHRKCIGIHDR